MASLTAPSANTVVFNLKQAVNPQWFWYNQLSEVLPMPSHAWAKAAAGGPTLDFTNPANAKKIWDYLNKQAMSLSTYTSNPLWQTVDGPYKLTQFNNTTGAFTMVPNPAYGGPHARRFPPSRPSRTPPIPLSSTRSGPAASTWVTCR